MTIDCRDMFLWKQPVYLSVREERGDRKYLCEVVCIVPAIQWLFICLYLLFNVSRLNSNPLRLAMAALSGAAELVGVLMQMKVFFWCRSTIPTPHPAVSPHLWTTVETKKSLASCVYACTKDSSWPQTDYWHPWPHAATCSWAAGIIVFIFAMRNIDTDETIR